MNSGTPASVALPDNPKFARYAPTHFLVRQMLFIAIAFVAALVVVQVPMAFWEKTAPWIFVASLLLLAKIASRFASPEQRRWAGLATAYAIGGLASYWLIDRVTQFV